MLITYIGMNFTFNFGSYLFLFRSLSLILCKGLDTE